MNDMIEEMVYEIIKSNNPEDAARVLTNTIYDVQSGYEIIESINANCEMLFG